MNWKMEEERMAFYSNKNNIKMLDKFRGCLVGALIGDCMGSLFEGCETVNMSRLQQHLDRSETNQGKNIKLTDDTQMTQELADSLISNRNFCAEDLARRFTTRYYDDGQNAGYGYNVKEVFFKLRESNFNEPQRPAQEQFDGAGSYGNGATMRVAPVALWAFPNLERSAEIAEKSAEVTHSHINGRHGAVFQTLALRWCLLASCEAPLNPALFLRHLEKDLIKFGICETYMEKLESIKTLVDKEQVSDSIIEDKLGTGVAALQSVPTALYCFLRCLQPIPDLATTNPFRRTVEYAISLGGDTDTIASMAGALAGSFYGLPGINSNMMRACPDSDRALSQADALYAAATPFIRKEYPDWVSC